MAKKLWWLCLPIIVMLLSIGELMIAQHTLTSPQKITYTTTVTKAKPQKNATIKEGNMKTLLKARNNTTNLIKQYGIGQLYIASQQLQLPIYNTVNDQTLSTGVAQYFPDRQFLHGNTVLAAHNFLDQDLLLHRIQDLKRGNEIIVTDYKNVYTYHVTTNKIVHQSQTNVLDDTAKNTLTLIRCVGGYGTNKRLVVKAKQVGKMKFSPTTQSWNIDKTSHVPKLNFIAQGLKQTYITNHLNWRLLVLLAANLLAISIALISYATSSSKKKRPS